MKNINLLSSLNSNPQFFGGFLIVAGVFLLLLAITDPDWFLGDNKTFNIQKIQGWANLFGRNFTRVIVGFMSIAMIVFGGFWIWAYKK